MPTLGASQTARGYRPRSSKNDLKEIVEEHLEELLKVYDERFRAACGPLHPGPLHPRVKELFEEIVRW